MATFYRVDSNNHYQKCSEENATRVMIDIQEYNGYEKAIRIIRDKAKLQVDKAQADENGYILLSASRTKIGKRKVWQIKKRTPYSIKIGVRDIKDIITKDLKEYYGFIEYRDTDTLLLVRDRWKEDENSFNYSYDSYEKELQIMYSTGGDFSFKLEKINANLGQGLYEIVYYATEPM